MSGIGGDDVAPDGSVLCSGVSADLFTQVSMVGCVDRREKLETTYPARRAATAVAGAAAVAGGASARTHFDKASKRQRSCSEMLWVELTLDFVQLESFEEWQLLE